MVPDHHFDWLKYKPNKKCDHRFVDKSVSEKDLEESTINEKRSLQNNVIKCYTDSSGSNNLTEKFPAFKSMND